MRKSENPQPSCQWLTAYVRLLVTTTPAPPCHPQPIPSSQSPAVASDKLFFWLFQNPTERLQPLVASLLPEMEGYTFTAPAIKEREVRLDSLFLPPTEQLDAKTALIMEAQMAPDPQPWRTRWMM